MEFVHLHNHSEYSLLDGAAKIEVMIERARQLEMSSLALTDHGNMYAAIEFFSRATEEKIKPIIGCEVYVAPRSRFDRESKEDRKPYHLTLLAKDETGYKNLLKLVTAGYLEGFYSKPRVDRELLEKYPQGLVAMSGCLVGEVPTRLLEGETAAAREAALFYRSVFGVDYYLEVMDNGIPEQKIVLPQLAALGKELGIGLVATNDTHYVRREDARSQDVLLCIQTGKTLDEEKRMRFSGEEFYLKSPAEMKRLFAEYPEAIQNTLAIDEKCNLTIPLKRMYLPDFPVPEGETANGYLEKLCREGILRLYGEKVPTSMHERFKYELSIIERMGYAPYFLIVADFIRYARERGIPVGPGRGSAAGSIVSYLLGITMVDPLKYGLIFERFLNPDRVSMPDIDIDFCIERRGEVVDYITRKYGSDHVAQIITFGTMAARGVLRDVGRVLNVPLTEVDRVAKMVPFGPDMTIEKGLEANKEFMKVYTEDPRVKNLVDTAKNLEGFARHASVHAAGIVISKNPLTDHVPLQKMNEDQIVTQYPMGDLEKIGLLKMDCLGLRNLTLMDRAVKAIEKNYGIKVDLNKIPPDDQKTFKMLADGETTGVFQLESRGMRSYIRKLQPDRFEDIVDLNALHRPGPLESGMADDFVERKRGRVKVEYELPELRPILEETHGVILYQEQVMQIASRIAGFSMGQADVLRSAMGKKKVKVMQEQKERFIDGAVKKGINQRKAASLFNLCSKFAEYGFNKSHATAYAVIAYQTAYLKANYPIEFMAALLTSVSGVTDKVADYISECRRIGLPVLPPDVNESGVDFTPLSSAIRFGLAAVKNVGLGAIESIIKERESGPFTSIDNFTSRVDLRLVNKRVIESLIKSGAFDSLGQTRAGLMKTIDGALLKGQRTQKERVAGQGMLFTVAKEEKTEIIVEAVPEFPMEVRLKMEKEMLGLYISSHPLEPVRELLAKKVTATVETLPEKKEGAKIVIGGMLTDSKRLTTKKGDLMLVGALEDFTGRVAIVVFPQAFEKYSKYLYDDQLLILKGKLEMRKEEWQVVVEEVAPVVSGEAGESQIVHIDVGQELSKELLLTLKEMLGQYRGKSPVVIHHAGHLVAAGQDYHVEVTPRLMQALEKLLGSGAAWAERAKGDPALSVAG